MGESAISYHEEMISQAPEAADANVLNDYVVTMDGETEDDWKYGSD